MLHCLKLRRIFLCFFMMLMLTHCQCRHPQSSLPSGFVFLTDIDPTIIESSRYVTEDNFLGRPVKGYIQSRIVCTYQAAIHLKQAHDMFKKYGYTLVVYDGYRPQCAVDDFKAWSMDPHDQIAKHLYYSTIDKNRTFELGYIAEKSGHSRGSTFDLTLIKQEQQVHTLQERPRQLLNGDQVIYLDDGTVDMGTSLDLFHPASHHDSPLINGKPAVLRHFLRHIMQLNGFKPYAEEWWHYTLDQEPYPDTYFTFVVS